MTDWMKSGEKYTKSDGQKARLQEIFKTVEWQEFVVGKKEAMMPAQAIKFIIKETNRKPIRYGISHELAPLGLYCIEFEYTDAIVKSYWVDDGVSYTCIASEPVFKVVKGGQDC